MLINGQPRDAISVEDRGLLYGDGVFETILYLDGNAILFDEHFSRLKRGCNQLSLAEQNPMMVKAEIDLVAENQDCVVKVMVTRGERSRGYRFDENDMSHSRIVYRSPIPEIPADYYEQGINLGISDYKLPLNAELAGIKHLNRLDQVLACRSWDPRYAERLVLDQRDQLVEGTMSNIFIEQNGQWFTPALESAGVAGVLREWLVKNLSHQSASVIESSLSLDDIYSADSVFVCNSVIGIWPVREFEDKSFNISDNLRTVMRHVNTHVAAYCDV